MATAIRERGVRPRAREDGSVFAYEIRYRVNGKHRSESFSVKEYRTEAKARNAAKRALARQREALHTGTWTDPADGNVPLGEVFEDYLRSTRRNGKPLGVRTVAWYRALWSAHIAPRPELALRKVRAITQRDISRLRDALVSEYEGREDRDGAATIQAVLRMLRAVFSQAIRDGVTLPRGNPATHVRSTKPEPREARVLDRAEVDALADEVPARYRALVLVLARCGLRIGEAAALRVGDVDELRRRVRVERSAGEVRGLGWQEGATKTGKARTVPIPRYVLDELLTHIATYAGGKDALLFTSRDGGPLRPNNWRKRVWYPACERARARGTLDQERPIPHVHDARHTAAILAMNDGVPPKVIQDILGHSSFKMTMDLYAKRASEELMDQASEAMDAAHREIAGNN